MQSATGRARHAAGLASVREFAVTGNGEVMTSMRRMLIVHGAAALLVTVAAIRVIATHRVFSHTFDEAYHLATGIEWLQRGKYAMDIFHPRSPA